jgi:hypothetical protein
MKSRLFQNFNSRAAAGYVFLSGNLTFMASQLFKGDFDPAHMAQQLATPQGAASVILLGGAYCIAHSKKNPRYLYPAAGGLIAAQSILGITASGPGQASQQRGSLILIFQGCLQLRAAKNEIAGNPPFTTHKVWQKPAEFIDRYPYVTAAAIQIPGVTSLAVGAVQNDEIGMAAAAGQWLLGNIFLFASDPRVHELTGAVRRATVNLGHKIGLTGKDI